MKNIKIGDRIKLRCYGLGTVVQTGIFSNFGYDLLVKLDSPLHCYYNELGKKQEIKGTCRFFYYNEVISIVKTIEEELIYEIW